MITSIANFLIGCAVLVLFMASIAIIMMGVSVLGYSREVEFFIHTPLILWTCLLNCHFIAKSWRIDE